MRLDGGRRPALHVPGVADSEAVRTEYAAAQEKIGEHASELGQNRSLYAAVKAVAESPALTRLPRAARTLVL